LTLTEDDIHDIEKAIAAAGQYGTVTIVLHEWRISRIDASSRMRVCRGPEKKEANNG